MSGGSANRMKDIRILMLGPAEDVRGGVSTIERMMLDNPPEGFTIELLKTMRDTSLPARLCYWVWRMMTVPVRAIFRRPKVVHLHISHGPSAFRKLTLGLAYWLVGCRIIYHIHSVDSRIFPRTPRLLHPLIRFCYRRGRGFIVLNDSWVESYSKALKLDKSRFLSLSNPVILPATVPDHPVGDYIQFLFSGRLETLKGVDELLPAFAELKGRTKRRVRLVLAGDGDLERYREMAETLGIEGDVEFAGWVGAEELEQLQTESHVYVLPSHTEGLPMGMLEAMARQLPVIVTPVGGIPDFIQDGVNGLLVDAKDTGALTDALHRFVEDEDLRLRIAKNGLLDIEPYGVSHYMKHVSEVWNSV
jgi:glycosyltransferase involved in cell wall biosynthesis